MVAGREPGEGDAAVDPDGLAAGTIDGDRVAVGIEIRAGRAGRHRQAAGRRVEGEHGGQPRTRGAGRVEEPCPLRIDRAGAGLYRVVALAHDRRVGLRGEVHEARGRVAADPAVGHRHGIGERPRVDRDGAGVGDRGRRARAGAGAVRAQCLRGHSRDTGPRRYQDPPIRHGLREGRLHDQNLLAARERPLGKVLHVGGDVGRHGDVAERDERDGRVRVPDRRAVGQAVGHGGDGAPAVGDDPEEGRDDRIAEVRVRGVEPLEEDRPVQAHRAVHLVQGDAAPHGGGDLGSSERAAPGLEGFSAGEGEQRGSDQSRKHGEPDAQIHHTSHRWCPLRIRVASSGPHVTRRGSAASCRGPATMLRASATAPDTRPPPGG